LASNNFKDAAVIDGNYLGTDRDFAAIVRAIEAARELGHQRALDNVREAEIVPGPNASADEIRELARLASASFGHAVGTCKIGVDELAVVDPELRVHGILGLRVADASVMPQMITGPGTNAATYMIGGRREADSRLIRCICQTDNRGYEVEDDALYGGLAKNGGVALEINVRKETNMASKAKIVGSLTPDNLGPKLGNKIIYCTQPVNRKLDVARTKFIWSAGHSLAGSWRIGFRPNVSSRRISPTYQVQRKSMPDHPEVMGILRDGARRNIAKSTRRAKLTFQRSEWNTNARPAPRG
jgi:hypothetical protein